MIDRISPTLRPDRMPAGYQQWRSLLFMHWSMPVEDLRPLVPKSLEIDLYEGIAYVGVVPFAMTRVRPRWCPEALGLNFLETNVRTYVTYQDRPGVYFFSLDAASRIGVGIARAFWGLPYYYAKMDLKKVDQTIDYSSTRPNSGVCHESQCKVGERLGQLEPDSIEFFFMERYLLFLEQSGSVFIGQVHHTPYPVSHTEVSHLRDDLLEAAGCGYCKGLPEFAHFSTGVDVEIFNLEQ
ncbi:YqjF family protein [Bythopirellula polymerisocia]|uniref:DUF2071 domain-containing protein n=1 Tax=Bythopirellula polymerisocia TaxID=2528003 RepID=A0A5C6CG81_9BACT|nr:DUF2071 domain-containing protein [Bythopirellula polymerisocia]TWU22727.1 hypothetical protein Pla144_41880 [Bythopirellula polymerisocia]